MTPRLLQGSDAVAESAIAAGCRFFTGYPMLPFTDLLESMARRMPGVDGVCMNAETEIEAINMTLGAGAAGARAATGSCGQGIALMQEAIAEAALNEVPGISCHSPEGAFYVFPNIAGLLGKTTPKGKTINSDEDFALALLDEAHVALVHGAAFGMSPYVRISYATDDDSLARAMTRIADFVATLS